MDGWVGDGGDRRPVMVIAVLLVGGEESTLVGFLSCCDGTLTHMKYE